MTQRIAVTMAKMKGAVELRVSGGSLLSDLLAILHNRRPRTRNRIGLIIGYDIVTAHGRVLEMKTHEEDGSEFIIQLPGI